LQAASQTVLVGNASGGTLERPAIKRLLEDVRKGLVNTIVVYKIDRLSRSLADFAKLVELFDQYKVTFVSVTQSFNTTTSMGRLTLNILLSLEGDWTRGRHQRRCLYNPCRRAVGLLKRNGQWWTGMAQI
jgi:hypothetical protein